MAKETTLSIIIVNYNVKEYLSQCLSSIYKSKVSFSYEIIVVDNNSSDGSVEFIQQNFPDVILLPLKENKGFGFGNNKGFELARGKYLLLLNPDTVLQEDTLEKMYEFMETHKDVGIAGCKVLNPDGTLQLACRRGFPTLWVAFTKLFGLQSLFPKSKLFARYNLTFLDPDEITLVDAISGSFMFVRREVYEQLGGFDVSFFMYGEDIDFSYRAKQAGWEVAYVPTTSIIHYKGESTKRSFIDSTYHFFKSMEIFARKHLSSSFWFIFLIRIGIFIRELLAKISKYKTEIFFVLSDLIFANLSLLIASWIRFGNMLSFPDYAYPTVFIVLSLVVFGAMVISGEYFEFKHSVWKTTFALLISFFVLSSLTYFFKDFAFSRGVLLLTIGFSLVFTNLTRMIFNINKKMHSLRRIAFVGVNQNTEAIVKSIEATSSTDFEIVGVILPRMGREGHSSLPILGTMAELPKVLETQRITELIVTDDSISKVEILEQLQKLDGGNVRVFYAQGYEDFVVSQVIYNLTKSEDVLGSLNLALFRYRLYKRALDLLLVFVFFTFGFPFLYLFFDKEKRKLSNFCKILIGKMTFVGLDEEYRQIYHKDALITISEASANAVLSPKSKAKLNQFYLQSWSPLLDLEILFKYKRGKDGKAKVSA